MLFDRALLQKNGLIILDISHKKPIILNKNDDNCQNTLKTLFCVTEH